MAIRFCVALAIPLVIAALALNDRLSEVAYWLSVFNLGPYRELAATQPTALDLFFAALWLSPMLLVRRSRPRHPFALVIVSLAAVTAVFPRYGNLHLLTAVPFVALLVGNTFARRSRLALYALALSCAAAIALMLPSPLRGESMTHVRALVAWFQSETNAVPRTRVMMLPETDGEALFYVEGRYLPPVIWSPPYDWFHHPSTGVTKRLLSSFEDHAPEYALLTTDALTNEWSQPQIVNYVYANYERVATRGIYEIWRAVRR